MMNMHPVKSSQIASIGHDGVSTMAIQFHGRGDAPGSIYHYANVTQEQFDEFKNAPSIGAHFGKHFKHNKEHPYTKQVFA